MEDLYSGLFEGALLGVLLILWLTSLSAYIDQKTSELLTGTWNPAMYTAAAVSGAVLVYIVIIHMQVGEVGEKRVKPVVMKDFAVGFAVGTFLVFAIAGLLTFLSLLSLP